MTQPQDLNAIAEPRVVRDTDLTYNDYLRVPQLLSLQVPESSPPHHDEMLFIIIHQAYELWFKLILHELEQAAACMNADHELQAHHFLRRVGEIMELLVKQIHILETMRPVDFLEFRDRLMPASGFQSHQFREVEFFAGLKDRRYLHFFQNRPDMLAQLQRRLDGPDLRDIFYGLLRRRGFAVPQDISLEHLQSDEADREALLDAVLPIYRDPNDHLPLYLLAEALMDLDQQLALWRDHHVRVVARIIGHKRGTGGSSGVDYLERTTHKRCFPYLWEVRTRLGTEK